MPACSLSTLRRHPLEWPTHDSGSWLVAIHYHVGDFHCLPFADFYRRLHNAPLYLLNSKFNHFIQPALSMALKFLWQM